MRIGIDLTYITDGIASGTGNYAQDIVRGLAEIGKAKDFLILVREDFYQEAKTLFPQFEIIAVEHSKLVETMIRHTRCAEILQKYYIHYLGVRRAAKKQNLDLLLHTFNERRIRFDKSIPSIVVIHDMQFKHFPKQLRLIVYFEARRAYKYFVKKADAIITTSEFTRNELVSYYKLADTSKIHVIPNAVKINETTLDKSAGSPYPRPYILCVNNHRYHKNGITLLRAFHLISHKIDHNLILLGKKEFEAPKLIQYIQDHNLSTRVRLIDSLSESARDDLYRNADLFVSPSLHEGFGRTPIEASMCKIPVITSRETSLPEVTMELVYYYEPALDAEALAHTMIRILENPPSEEELDRVKNIYEQEYNAERIAQAFYDLCTSMINQEEQGMP